MKTGMPQPAGHVGAVWAWVVLVLPLLWGGAFLPTSARAQVPVPALSGPVVDQTNTLSAAQAAALAQRLADFEARKGTQVAVLIVPSTAPEPIEQYALRVAEAWKLGRKRVDDGAILVIAKNDRALRIEVGYGLEGALNDATAKRIISEVIVPRFQAQDFAGGIAAGVDKILAVVDGEPLPPPARTGAKGARDEESPNLPAVLLVAVVAGGVLRAVLGRLAGSLATGGLVAAVAWWLTHALFFTVLAGGLAGLFTLMGGMGWLSSRGAFDSRRGGGGGFGGGGFSGGGGSFGGGGASGRW